jgi:hypothetical protein
MWEIYDLARHLLENSEEGFTYDEHDEDFETDIETDFYNTFNIDINDFDNLARKLIPLCAISRSEITNNVYQGFAGGGMWLMRREIK